MRGNHDNGMCFQTMQLIAVAVAMVFVLCVTAGTIGALAKADDGSYMLQSSSATELMGDFGVICFDFGVMCLTHCMHRHIFTVTLSQGHSVQIQTRDSEIRMEYMRNSTLKMLNGCVAVCRMQELICFIQERKSGEQMAVKYISA